MLRRSDRALLEQVQAFQADIAFIVGRHGSIEDALADIEGQYSLMLCLSQIGELIGKVSDEDLRSRLPVRMAAGLRNIIVHNYQGIDVRVVASTIEVSLPELSILVDKILSED